MQSYSPFQHRLRGELYFFMYQYHSVCVLGTSAQLLKNTSHFLSIRRGSSMHSGIKFFIQHFAVY